MRAVEKGNPPRKYTQYRQARLDLVARIGEYCSYCEMPIKNSPEVEHVHPVAHQGNALDWENFLLACRYCNGIKGKQNLHRSTYLWPDLDNTLLAFAYANRLGGIGPRAGLPDSVQQAVQRTIELVGLNRHPGSQPAATMADNRWRSRQEAWGIATKSREDWLACPTPAMARQIGRTAQGHGFYAIWLTVFDGIEDVLTEIKARFPGTYEPIYDANGTLQSRTLAGLTGTY